MPAENNLPAAIAVCRKPFIVGIMGSHKDEALVNEQARRLGEAVALRGCVLLTGGGPGIMRAASEGAYRAGGLVIGILPNERARPLPGYPNEFVDIPVYTGLSDARNVINAKTPHVLIALNGGVGTLSEIAFALRAQTPVIALGDQELAVPGEGDITKVVDLESAIAALDAILQKWEDHREKTTQGDVFAVKLPKLPEKKT